MFGLSTELITKGKLATVKRFELTVLSKIVDQFLNFPKISEVTLK